MCKQYPAVLTTINNRNGKLFTKQMTLDEEEVLHLPETEEKFQGFQPPYITVVSLSPLITTSKGAAVS